MVAIALHKSETLHKSSCNKLTQEIAKQMIYVLPMKGAEQFNANC